VTADCPTKFCYENNVHRPRPLRIQRDYTDMYRKCTLSRMDQSTVVLFFAKLGLRATQIERELKATLGAEAKPYSTITYTLRSRSWTHPTPDTVKNPWDDAIRQTLDEMPFASVQQRAHRLCQSSTTIYRHLTGALGFGLKHLRWVLHPHNSTTSWPSRQVRRTFAAAPFNEQ
jgi:hypothetical protein